MDILEGMCQVEHGCNTIALDTRAYENDEDKTPSRNKMWYQRRGYVEYRVRWIQGRFLHGFARSADRSWLMYEPGTGTEMAESGSFSVDTTSYRLLPPQISRLGPIFALDTRLSFLTVVLSMSLGSW
jgi:hypothetical protein